MSVNDMVVTWGPPASFVAEETINDYDMVMVGTAPNGILKTTGATVRAIGIVRNGGTVGQNLSVYMVSGFTMLARVAAAVTKGDLVGPIADGECATVAAHTTSKLYCGEALKAATANNDIIPIIWKGTQTIVTHA
jgi:hypothetical protein